MRTPNDRQDRQFANWARKRRKGMLYHILIRSVTQQGGLLLAILYGLARWAGHQHIDAAWWTWSTGWLSLFFGFLGWLGWRAQEREFHAEAARRDPPYPL